MFIFANARPHIHRVKHFQTLELTQYNHTVQLHCTKVTMTASIRVWYLQLSDPMKKRAIKWFWTFWLKIGTIGIWVVLLMWCFEGPRSHICCQDAPLSAGHVQASKPFHCQVFSRLFSVDWACWLRGLLPLCMTVWGSKIKREGGVQSIPWLSHSLNSSHYHHRAWKGKPAHTDAHRQITGVWSWSHIKVCSRFVSPACDQRREKTEWQTQEEKREW